MDDDKSSEIDSSMEFGMPHDVKSSWIGRGPGLKRHFRPFSDRWLDGYVTVSHMETVNMKQIGLPAR